MSSAPRISYAAPFDAVAEHYDQLFTESRIGQAQRASVWTELKKAFSPGNRVLEIGSGIGTLTGQFIPRELYLASDINPSYLSYLRSYSVGKPYLRVRHIDAGVPGDFASTEGQFDTVLMVNVLEHVPNEQITLENIKSSLMPGGRAVILVPQHPALYGTLDSVLGHRERYTRESLREGLERAGFRVERIFDFNRFSVPGWWLSGKVLRRKTFSRIQLKILQMSMPVLRRLDSILPWGGLSLIAVATKPQDK